jgi:DNA mismatch repair protein MutS
VATVPPLLAQYRQIKSGYPDAILLFQVGDFFEMFYEDAREASALLELALTARDKQSDNPVPLCGVPIHAVEGYIARLIKAGRNVAVCEQMEEPGQGKGPVRREVTRVVTPGTVTDDHLLEGGRPNYLAAVCPAVSPEDGAYGLAWVDVSTGDFRLMDLLADPESGPADERLAAELARIEPRELLVPDAAPEALEGIKAPVRAWGHFDPRKGEQALKDHLQVATLAGFGIEDATPAVGAAGALLAFLTETQRGVLPQITAVRPVATGAAMVIDPATFRNLELTRRVADGRRTGTLLAQLDRTRTPMGARAMREWLTAPLLDRDAIGRRHGAVAWFLEHPEVHESIVDLLGGIADLERLAARAAMGRAGPRDLAALAASLAPLPVLGGLLPSYGAEVLGGIRAGWDDLADLHEDLVQSLSDEVPAALKEGGVIRTGVSPELDELRAVGKDVRGALTRMEAAERGRTGIESLKVRHNNVFGYYIEVTRAQLATKGVPDGYQRKQTLVNAERFITPELKELEAKVLSAADRIAHLEAELFAALRSRVGAQVARLQWTAAAVGAVDALSALAGVAHERGWVRPEVVAGRDLAVQGGRHPAVEAMLPAGTFVANDTALGEEAPVWIVTGPNMAGKSTYLRQVALICLLAQMGSFVPAASARIGVVDRIFSRIGASDNLAEGLSTFMVEMTETAGILHNATDRSLVILDEIGRGTSTFDGLSIAWAVAEHLHDRVGCRTLFATHYHELTELAAALSGVRNVNVQVREWNDEIVFLHRIEEGAADRSYGIQVARLAGLPKPVVGRAREVLANLEGGELDPEGRPRIATHRAAEAGAAEGQDEGKDQGDTVQYDLFGPQAHPVLAELKGLDLKSMTPLEAMNALDRLQRKL